MKVVSKILMLLVLLVGLFLFGLPNSQATDVWVAQNSNGQLIGDSTTQYSKYETDMWRYYIKTQQAGRFEPVTPKSQVFEYVMKNLR